MVSNLLNCLFIPEISEGKHCRDKAIQVSVIQKNISTESIINITGLMTIEGNCFQLTAYSIWAVEIDVQNGFHKATIHILNPNLTLYEIIKN